MCSILMNMCSSTRFNSANDQAKAKYAALLRQCSNLEEICAIHQEIAREGRDQGTFLGNILIRMYGKYSRTQLARSAFEGINWKNVFSWTMIITAYAQNGQCKAAIRMYLEMSQGGLKPDKVAFLSILCAFGQLGCLREAVLIQERVVSTGFDLDVVIANAVIDMYGKCKSLKHARSYFDSIVWKDVISWNSIISVYVQLGLPREAIELYHKMMLESVTPDDATFVCALGACALLEDVEIGRAVRRHADRSGYDTHLLVGTAVVNMYGKCGCFVEAREAFERIPNKDTICWTNMITAYSQCGRPEEALKLTCIMELEGFKPNLATFVSLIEACSQLGDVKSGKSMHARIVSSNFEWDVVLKTAVLHMYAKFGSVLDARTVFEKLRCVEDSVTWNCMLMAYAENGYGGEVLRLYQEMVVEGLTPTDITFVGILCACSHLGLWEKGHEHFGCMIQDFGIEATAEHYGCMVDLFGRSGRVQDAQRLIESMPVYPSSVMWKVLLSACKVHNNMEVGSKAALYASQLEPHDDSTYILLSNIFQSA